MEKEGGAIKLEARDREEAPVSPEGEADKYKVVEGQPPVLGEETLEVNLADVRAELVGKRVRMTVELRGEQDFKAIPSKLEVQCVKCDHYDIFDVRRYPELLEPLAFKDMRKVKSIVEIAFNNIHGPCEGRGSHAVRIFPREYTDFAILAVSQPVGRIEQFTAYTLRHFKERMVYLVGQEIPEVKLVTIEGTVAVEPFRRNLTIIADHIEPAQTALDTFTITEKDKELWEKAIKDNEEIYREIAPHIVGRDLAKKWYSLVLHSPMLMINLDGNLRLGMLRLIFIGDTTTGKSEILKFMTPEGDFPYPVMGYSTAETATRTGLLYNINPDIRAIIWGTMPMNDCGGIVVDGMENMSHGEMTQFREALRIGKIIVDRVVKGRAYARVRFAGAINMSEENSIDRYPFKCMAILDTNAFRSAPNITRIDAFIPFSQRDVDQAAIDQRRRYELPIPPKIFFRHILWAWSRKPEHIVMTEEAEELIRGKATMLVRRFGTPLIPVFNPGTRETLTKCSIAAAIQMHSTDETHKKVIVRPEDVEYAVQLLTEMGNALQLQEYKEHTEGSITIVWEDVKKMISALDDVDLTIIEMALLGPTTSEKVAEKLGITPVTVRNHYAKLRELGLVETKGRMGVQLTVKAIRFYNELVRAGRAMREEEGAEERRPSDEQIELEWAMKAIREELRRAQTSGKPGLSLEDLKFNLQMFGETLIEKALRMLVSAGSVVPSQDGKIFSLPITGFLEEVKGEKEPEKRIDREVIEEAIGPEEEEEIEKSIMKLLMESDSPVGEDYIIDHAKRKFGAPPHVTAAILGKLVEEGYAVTRYGGYWASKKARDELEERMPWAEGDQGETSS